MAKQAEDKKTAELFEVKRGRGRPATGLAVSAAERTRRYRDRKAAKEELERRDATRENKCAVAQFEHYTEERLRDTLMNEWLSDDVLRRVWIALGVRKGWIDTDFPLLSPKKESKQ